MTDVTGSVTSVEGVLMVLWKSCGRLLLWPMNVVLDKVALHLIHSRFLAVGGSGAHCVCVAGVCRLVLL